MALEERLFKVIKVFDTQSNNGQSILALFIQYFKNGRMNNMTLAKIVYATNTGNTEGISEILEDAFTAIGVDVERVEADDAEPDFYEDADICVLATYTDGDGELPFDLEDFYEELPDAELDGKIYGVVGTGDSELYPDYFCQAAIDFAEAFAKTGATKAAETVKIENEADDEDEEVLKAFVKTLVEAAE